MKPKKQTPYTGYVIFTDGNAEKGIQQVIVAALIPLKGDKTMAVFSPTAKNPKMGILGSDVFDTFEEAVAARRRSIENEISTSEFHIERMKLLLAVDPVPLYTFPEEAADEAD